VGTEEPRHSCTFVTVLGKKMRYCEGIRQLLAYADDVNMLGGSIHILKENAEAQVAATREIGLEVSADKTKYMVMSR